MRYGRRQKHQISGLIALVLFGVFAACVLSVLLTGARVYRDLTTENREAYARRVCAQYIATKVRQAESGEAVDVTDIDGVAALSLSEVIDGETYVTMIYCCDGWLRELFTFEGAQFLPQDGEKVVEAKSAAFALEDGVLSVELEGADGVRCSFDLCLRGRGAAS